MKKILLLLSFSLICSCSYLDTLDKKIKKFVPIKRTEAVASQEFLQGSEDIPLIIGMEKISDGILGFDSAAGSIISSSYSTKLDKAEIKNFYLKTLPQMGWSISHHVENSVKFKRDKEDLEIEFATEDQMEVVRFFYSSMTE